MKKIKLLLLIIVIPTIGFSQDMTLFAGASQASMASLRALSKDVTGYIPIDMKVTEDFPVYLRYGMLMRWQYTEKVKLGYQLSTTSTGSRAIYEDYSGSVRFDQKVKNISIGGHASYQVFSKEKSTVDLYGEAGVNFSTYKYIFHLEVGDRRTHYEHFYNASNFYFEFGGVYAYKLSEQFSVLSNLGLQVNTGGVIRADDDDRLYDLVNHRRVDWTGLKLNVGVTYRFK